MCVPHTPLTHTHKYPLPHLYPWSNSSQREKAVRKSGSNLQYNTGCHTPRWWLMAYILWPREERRAESELQMGVLNSLRSTATCVEKTKHPPEFAQLGSWQCYAITPLKDESQVFLESKTVKFWGVFLLPGKLNKLDSWGLLGFAGVHLGSAFLGNSQKFALRLPHTHSHMSLATGVQQCSAVETKHGSVLTGCDPCFRVKRCQKQIDGSHPEGGFYRKIRLAGILLLLLMLDSKNAGSQSWWAPGQSTPQVMMKGMLLCMSHVSFKPSLLQFYA